MPRAASAKAAGAASKAAPKKPSTKRKANGYQMPEPIPLGAVFTDLSKQQWKVGPAIGSGGFGEIYCACKATEATKKYDDYQYVIKVVSHSLDGRGCAPNSEHCLQQMRNITNALWLVVGIFRSPTATVHSSLKCIFTCEMPKQRTVSAHIS